MTVTPDQTGNPLVDNGIIPLAQHFQSLHPDAQSAVIQGIENHIANSAPPSQGPVQGAIPVSAPPRASIPGSIPVDGPQGAAPATITPRVMPPPSDPAMSAGNEMADAAQPAPKPAAAQPANGMIPVPVKYTPAPTPMQDRYNTLAQSQSGIGQIHNPLARVPLQVADALGSFLVPRLMQNIPGTQLHHEQLVGDAENAAKEEQSANTSAAQQEHEAAGTEEQKALALQHGQDAQRASNAPPPTITTDKGILQWNPETHAYDKAVGAAPPKEEMEGKTLNTDQGIFQWNPATKRYDIKAGDTPDAKTTGTVHQLEDGLLVVAHPDGTATAVTLNGKPVQGKTTDEKPDTSAQDDQKYEALAAKQAMGTKLTPEETAQMKAYEKRKTLGAVTTNVFANQRDEKKEALATDKETDKAKGALKTSLTKEFSGVQQQLDAIQDARNELASNPVGQSLGTIKTIVAVAGGKGSGVRITQPELNSVVKDLGIKETFENWVSNISGQGKMGPAALAQVNAVLAAVEKKALEKEQNLNGTLDQIDGAKSKDDLTKIEQDYRHGSLHGGGAATTVSTQAQYDALPKGAKYIDANGVPGTKK